MLIRIAIMIALFFGSPELAFADQYLATCDAAKGWSYYLPSAVTSEKEAGWVKDGTGGQTILARKTDGSFDILFQHEYGTQSIISTGASITPIEVDETAVSLLVQYPGHRIENYYFNLEKKVMFNTKAGESITGGLTSAFHASCR